MLVDYKDRVLFMGDSITDSGRNYQAIPAGRASWGEGYVNLINAYTTATLPERSLMIVNRGISGDTIKDLKERWKADVLDFKADWVTIMIGINDIWRQFDGTFAQIPGVDKIEFEQIYRELIEQTLPTVKGIILLAPFMVERNTQDPMRQKVDEYRHVVQRLAEEYQLPFGDVQVAIDQFLNSQSSYVLSSDRIHVSLAGHVLIAKTWLEVARITEAI